MNRAAIRSPPVSVLILALGPPPALFGLLRGYEPGAAEHGELGRMPVAVRCREGLDRRRLVVVPHRAGDRADEDALAVAARAVGEGQDVLPRRARKGVAGEALQVALQVPVAAGHTVEEREPERRHRQGGRGGDLRQVVSGPCGPMLPVRRSTTPPGVFKSHGSRSHWSTLAARRRSARDSEATAATVFAEPILSRLFLLQVAAASRQTARARSKASRVSSCAQRSPVQVTTSTKRRHSAGDARAGGRSRAPAPRQRMLAPQGTPRSAAITSVNSGIRSQSSTGRSPR